MQQLSPENIAQLQRMFFPQIMAGQSALGQTALHGLARSQARRGLAQSPLADRQQLGLQAALANQAQQQAFAQAFGLAQQRAGVWAQNPSQVAPNYHMANAVQQGLSLALLAASLSGKGNQAQAAAPTYGNVNWNDNFGLQPGLPPSYYFGQAQQPTPNWMWQGSRTPTVY